MIMFDLLHNLIVFHVDVLSNQNQTFSFVYEKKKSFPTLLQHIHFHIENELNEVLVNNHE